MEYTIEKDEKDKYVVTIDGKVQSNVMGAIREIYRETGLKYDNMWTARQIIAKLKMFLDAKKQIIGIMQSICNEIGKNYATLLCPVNTVRKFCTSDLYSIQRKQIENIFNAPIYNIGNIMQRLTIIDSFYSTNARYNHFSILEMAEAIYSLGTEKDAQYYFYQIVLGKNDTKHLFSKHYGIHKNLSNGDKPISLLSKYAYYALIKDKANYPLGFPIYDKLVREFYPKVCKMLGINATSLKTDIDNYVKSMDKIRKLLFGNNCLFNGYQQYDILDAYMWRMGKFENGNLSLLLCRCDYELFIKNLGLQFASVSNFDKEVVTKCADAQKYPNPFNGLANGIYLKKLLDHWRMFHI